MTSKLHISAGIPSQGEPHTCAVCGRKFWNSIQEQQKARILALEQKKNGDTEAMDRWGELSQKTCEDRPKHITTEVGFRKSVPGFEPAVGETVIHWRMGQWIPGIVLRIERIKSIETFTVYFVDDGTGELSDCIQPLVVPLDS